MPAKKAAMKKAAAIPVPANDWRTTDQDEILRRLQRARDEKHAVANLHTEHPVFSTFAVKSPITIAPPAIRMLFDSDGYLAHTEDLEQAVETIRRSRSSKLRLSQDVEPFLENRRRVLERLLLRRDYSSSPPPCAASTTSIRSPSRSSSRSPKNARSPRSSRIFS